MSNTFKQICEFIKSEEFTTAFEQFKASKEPKKEWEIVAYLNGGCIYKRQEGDSGPKFSDGNCYFNTDFANEPRNKCLIHSVRRLPDGEIFTLNEVVSTPHYGEHHIGGFEIMGNQLCANFSVGKLFIRHLIKKPAALFTTLDGKEIHEGDEFFGVRDWTVLDGGKADKYDRVFDKAGVTFSTREAAQEYIENNKPLLSLNDVKQAAGNANTSGKVLNDLTNLVKSKL